MHLCVYSIFTFLFLPLSLISVPNANAELTDPLNPWSPFEERAFLEFVKGLEKWKLNNEAKENLSHLLGGIKEKHTKLTKLKGTDFDKAMKEDLALRFESILGTLYLLVENWRCDDHEQTKRQKYRKYLYFAHEYLFRVFIKTANPKLSEQMPAVAPRFQHEKVSEDIRQQFVGNSEIQIREQFHEFLKRMYETTQHPKILRRPVLETKF
uniref:Uncharacterized protein n=1 Tax=Globodera rostochiensis TaxID=31243 RepID=A0A914HMP9_GLORO